MNWAPLDVAKSSTKLRSIPSFSTNIRLLKLLTPGLTRTERCISAGISMAAVTIAKTLERPRVGEFLEYAASVACLPVTAELSSILCTPNNVSLGFESTPTNDSPHKTASWVVQAIPLVAGILGLRSPKTPLGTLTSRATRVSALRSARFPLLAVGIGELAQFWVTRTQREDKTQIQETIPLEFAGPLGEYSIVHGPSNPYDGLNQIAATIDQRIGTSTRLARDLAIPADARPFFTELLHWQIKPPPKFEACKFEQKDSETDSTVLLTPNQQQKLKRVLGLMASKHTTVDIANSSDHMYGDDLTFSFQRQGMPASHFEFRGPHRRVDFLRPEPIAALAQALLCLQSSLPEEGGVPLGSCTPGIVAALLAAVVSASQDESSAPWAVVFPLLMAPFAHGWLSQGHANVSSTLRHAPIAPTFGVSAVALALIIRNADVLSRKELLLLGSACVAAFLCTQRRYLFPMKALHAIRTVAIALTLIREGIRLLERLEERQKPKTARHTDAWRDAFLLGRANAIAMAKADCATAKRRIDQAEESGSLQHEVIAHLRSTLSDVEKELRRDSTRRYR